MGQEDIIFRKSVKQHNEDEKKKLNACIEAISLRAIQGISNRNKVFPPTLPNELCLVATK